MPALVVTLGVLALQTTAGANQVASSAPAAAAARTVTPPYVSGGADSALRLAAKRLSGGAFDFAPTGRSMVALDLPAPVQTFEAERWARLLDLSEAQVVALNAAYATYRDDFERLGESEIRALWEKSSLLADCDGRGIASDCLKLADELSREQARVQEKVLALDSQLLERTKELLSSVQMESWPRVTLYRERERSRYVGHWHNAAAIDLSAMLDLMESNGILELHDGSQYRAVVAEYEALFTRLVVEYKRTFVRASPTGRKAVAAIETRGENAFERSQYESRWGSLRTLERRMVEFNRTYIDVLTAYLNPMSAATLQAWFDQGAYPLVWQDRPPRRPESARMALDGAALNGAARTQLEDALATYAAEQDRIENQMRDLYDRFATDGVGKHPREWKPEFDARSAELAKARLNSLAVLESIVASITQSVGIKN